MASTRYTDGMATVTLDEGMARFVRAAMSRAEAAAVAVLETHAEELAATARREWYGPEGVDRETGKSGDIQVVTTVDAARGTVRVSIGSTDDRKGGKTNKPLVAFVHRPWGSSLRAKAVERGEWYAWQRKGLPVLPYPGAAWWSERTNGRINGEGLRRGVWYIQATDAAENKATTAKGKGYLLQTLVVKPTKELAVKLLPKVSRALAARLSSGGA